MMEANLTQCSLSQEQHREMSIILTAASLIRGKPDWFEKANQDWRTLALASGGLAAVIELIALFVAFLFLDDARLFLRIVVFSPIAFCLVQSIVTDYLYRKADSVILTIAIVLMLIPIVVVSPLLALMVLLLSALGYTVLRSDGLAMGIVLAALVNASLDIRFFALSVAFIGIATGITSMLLAKRFENKLPMVPIILSWTILTVGTLVGFDITI